MTDAARGEKAEASGWRFPRREAYWYVILLLASFLLGCQQMAESDIWWHLRTGQLILERHEVPATDWFTYTNPSAPWIDLHWGFQVPAALIWQVGGQPLLIMVKSLIGALTFALCLTMRHRSCPAWLVVACWLFPVLLFACRYFERPEMITYLLVAATMAVLHHAPRYPRLIWLLPLIQLYWVNSHGLFILQFVVLGCYLADRTARLVSRWGEDPQQHPIAWPRLLLATSLCGVASFVNPYGLRGVTFPWVLLQRLSGPQRPFFLMFSEELRGIRELIDEFGLSVLYVRFSNLSLLLLLAGCVATWLILLVRFRRLQVYHTLLLLATAYLAWQMQRNGSLAVVTAGSIFCWQVGHLYSLWGASGVSGQVLSAEELVSPAEPTRAAGHVVLARLVVAIGLLFVLISGPTNIFSTWIRPTSPPRWFGFSPHLGDAHDAARFLKQPGMPRQIYACGMRQAAVCIFHLGPEQRVFADARLETNLPSTLWNYGMVQFQLAQRDPKLMDSLRYGMPRDDPGLPALLFGMDFLVQNPQVLGSLLECANLRCVYSDPEAIPFGGMVFLSIEQAERLGLPAQDMSWWQGAARYLLEQKRAQNGG